MKLYQKMRKRIVFAILFVVFTCGAAVAQSTWKVDPNHSKLTFMVTHMGIADILGLFQKFDATITASQADFSDAVFELSVDVSSINTEVQKRDDHLRSADFFDVEKFPTIAFKSSSIEKSGENRYRLSGDLTMYGITKPVTMDLWYRGTIENNGAQTSGFQLTGVLKRSDFNIGPGFPPPMLSDEVHIQADGEFIQQ